MTTHETQSQPVSAATAHVLLSVDEAAERCDAAYRAWSADPGAPDLLVAYVRSRREVHAARQRANAAVQAQAPQPGRRTTPGGPLVITPVFEWWQA